MLDHVFTDAIGALRDVLEAGVHLEPVSVEERFQIDLMLGDITWQGSYGLPGEGVAPPVRADLELEWSTWSQTSYRDWYLTQQLDVPPSILVEVTFRLDRLATEPDAAQVVGVMPQEGPTLTGEPIHRATPSVQRSLDESLNPIEYGFEVAYEGEIELDERALRDGSVLDDRFSSLGGWISSTLVQLGDLKLTHRTMD